MERLWSSPANKTTHGNIRPRFVTFRSSRRVRGPPPLPAATEPLTQYPETYVVSRDPARYYKRLLAPSTSSSSDRKVVRFSVRFSGVGLIFTIRVSIENHM